MASGYREMYFSDKKTKGFYKQILCNLFCKTVDTLDHLIQFNLDRPIIKRKQHVEKSLSIIGSCSIK